MARLIIIAMLLLIATVSNGQQIVKESLSQQEVADLLKSLNKKTEDTTRIDILLELAEHYLQKENSGIDSAAAFIRNSKEVNAKQITRKRDGLILLLESSLARKSGNTNEGRQLLMSAIGQLQNAKDEFHLIKAYLELSCYYDQGVPEHSAAIKNTFDSLFQYVSKVISQKQPVDWMLELTSFYHLEMRQDLVKLEFLDHLVRNCRMRHDKVNELWAKKEIADIHLQQGKTTIALNELHDLLKEHKAGSYPRICFTYDLIAGAYIYTSEYEKALLYSLEAVRTVRSAFDSTYLPEFYKRNSHVYIRLGNQKEALVWSMKCYNYQITTNQHFALYNIITTVVSQLIGTGQTTAALDFILMNERKYVPLSTYDKKNLLLSMGRAYAAVNENVQAEKYYREYIELAQAIKNIAYDYSAFSHIAWYYVNHGQYDKAEEYFSIAMEGWPKGNMSGAAFNKSAFYFKLDSSRGKYVSAIKHLQVHQLMKDSTFTAVKNKQIEDLKISYETEQKDQLINLKEKDIQLLTNQAQQASLIRNLTIAGIIAMAIIAGLLFRQSRLRKKNNTVITIKNEQLQHFLTEKEWLLKEIHHRVKNNLQIVMSLLNSQSAYINNESALTAIRDSQHRVHAMSLIHQKLYSSENVSSIDISRYIRELVSYLADSFNTGQRIRFEFDVEPLELDVSQSVPLGLILNEAITNSIKYAFPDERNGIITISLSSNEDQTCRLTISDNGIGLPVQFNTKKPGSLGMSLMNGLSEDLGGTFCSESDNGTIVTISFAHDQSVKRPVLTNQA